MVLFEYRISMQKYLLIALLSILTLISAVYIEYVLDIKPCKLCLYQRIPYIIAIFLCFFGYGNFKNLLWGYLLILTFVISLILSGYHAGIENDIFQEFSGCSANNLNIIDKIIREPYVSRLDDLFDGEKEALVIDNSLTTYTHQLFTPEYLNEYSSLAIFDSYKNAIKENSLLETELSGDILLIHSKEDEIVPYSQSEKFYASAISSGTKAELVLLEKGKHNIQDYVGAVVDALDWLNKYE